jgi:hypothetical protein
MTETRRIVSITPRQVQPNDSIALALPTAKQRKGPYILMVSLVIEI